LEGDTLARPRIIRFKNGGEVIMKNISPDEADRLTLLIEGKELKQVEVKSEWSAPPEYKIRAMGTYERVDGWHVIELGFDPITGDTMVVASHLAGRTKGEAIGKFKHLTFIRGII
jgi:hypothetical protein